MNLSIKPTKTTNSKKSRGKRILRVLLTIILPLVLIYVLVAFVPYFIKPGLTQSLTHMITQIWTASSIIQFGIYALIAFYFFPKMADKKRQTAINYLLNMDEFKAEGLYEDLAEVERADFNADYALFQRQIEKLNQMTSRRNQWIVMGICILFDLFAGQLPFWLMTR